MSEQHKGCTNSGVCICIGPQPVFFDSIGIGQYKLPERLRKREAERKAALEKRKQNKDAATKDNVQHFTIEFMKGKSEIEDGLSCLGNVKERDLILAFDELNAKIQQLQKLVTDSVLFLPSYSLQSSQQHLSHLQTLFADKQDKLMPKKKFTFTMRKKEGDPLDHSTLPKEDKGDELCGTLLNNNTLVQCGFSNKQGKELSLNNHEINGYDVILDNLIRCDVKLFGSPLTLHATNCSESKIFCGPVCGSVFVDNCRNCTFIVACQQLRTHRTRATAFYLHVTSKGIIEDCSNIKFAPYNWNYPELNDHYEYRKTVLWWYTGEVEKSYIRFHNSSNLSKQASGLDKSRNNWNKIDDFNWLSVTENSPNWTEIDNSERVKNWQET